MTPEEIVKRLRELNPPLRSQYPYQAYQIIDDAADLIERQAKALEEAEKALGPFAFLELWTDTYPDGPLAATSSERRIPPERVVEARAALATIRAARGEGKYD